MFFSDRPVDGTQLGARRLEIRAGREAAEEFRHPMDSSGHHRRRQMMGACHHVGDDFGFCGIRHRGFQHPDDGGRARAKSDGFAEHGRIAVEPGLPKTIGQYSRAGRVRAVVSRVEQPAEDWVQPHHLEIRSADDARTDLTRFAEAYHGEADGGEVTERAQSLDARAQILNFGHGKRSVVGADATRTLADVDQAILVAIDKRPQQHAAHHAKDGGVSADAQRQREHHGDRKPLDARERADREFQVAQEGQEGFLELRILRVLFGHDDCSFNSVARHAARRSRLWVQPASIPARYGAALSVLLL